MRLSWILTQCAFRQAPLEVQGFSKMRKVLNTYLNQFFIRLVIMKGA